MKNSNSFNLITAEEKARLDRQLRREEEIGMMLKELELKEKRLAVEIKKIDLQIRKYDLSRREK